MAVLSPDQYPSLSDLVAQLKSNTSTLSKIEKGLQSVFIQPKVTVTVSSADTSTDSAGLKLAGQEDIVLKPDQDKGSQSPPQEVFDRLDGFVSPLTEDVQVCVCWSVCLSVCVCLLVCLSKCVSVGLSECVSVGLSV